MSAGYNASKIKISDLKRVNLLSDSEKCELILSLFNENTSLVRKLEAAKKERDNLLCEINKLKFELEVSTIKTIRDDNTR